MEKGTLVTGDGKQITDVRTLAGQIGLAKAMRKYDLLVFTGGGAYALDSRRRTRTVATTRGGFRDWRRRSR